VQRVLQYNACCTKVSDVPRVVDHTARRRHVAQCASRLIAEGGTEAATVREVARAAGSSTTIVSHYFRDKRELLEFTYQEAAAEARGRAHAVLAADPRDVHGVVETLLPLDGERLDYWRVNTAFWGLAVGDHALAAEQRARVDGARDLLIAALAERGAPAPEVAAEELLALVIGIAVQAVFDPGRWPAERQRALVRSIGLD
jgi:AcrR family transcriptional regulator